MKPRKYKNLTDAKLLSLYDAAEDNTLIDDLMDEMDYRVSDPLPIDIINHRVEVQRLRATIARLEADNARLRAALGPFGAAWLTISSLDEITCQIATVAQGKIIHLLFDDKDGWLRALDLRAAAAALAGDEDREGDDD